MPMNSETELQNITRRHFFGQCGMGIGSMALASLLSEGNLGAAEAVMTENPLEPKRPHFKPRAKNVIFLFMA